jgi:Flp pilus assembly protein TadD
LSCAGRVLVPADTLNPAMVAFKEGDYATALNLVNQEIRKSPEDGVLHEFRALVLFANKDFQQAAATIHSVLAVGPGWDWSIPRMARAISCWRIMN